jgi:hypothetical protein
METRRWTNPSLPQTLQIAVFLLYFRAVIGLLLGAFVAVIGLLLVVAMAAAGFGIANEKRWGYRLGVGAAILALLPVALAVATGRIGLLGLFDLGIALRVAFDIALIALLLHPTSREYQKIWFK